jgi:hypothetical protein
MHLATVSGHAIDENSQKAKGQKSDLGGTFALATVQNTATTGVFTGRKNFCPSKSMFKNDPPSSIFGRC